MPTWPRWRPPIPHGRCGPTSRPTSAPRSAARQHAIGHTTFTCATPREAVGMAAAGLGRGPAGGQRGRRPPPPGGAHRARRRRRRSRWPSTARRPSPPRPLAGIRRCLIDVDVGLPRCGCDPADAGRLADLARSKGIEVRGVMGYEGHLMALEDRERQRADVAGSMTKLLAAHADVGGDIISAGGTGTYDLHADTGVNEIQAGSYALMDTAYAKLALPFRQALFVVGTVISVRPDHAVADVGLKALGMDHGNPSITGASVWFCSDEHVTFARRGRHAGRRRPGPGRSRPTSTRRWPCTRRPGSSTATRSSTAGPSTCAAGDEPPPRAAGLADRRGQRRRPGQPVDRAAALAPLHDPALADAVGRASRPSRWPSGPRSPVTAAWPSSRGSSARPAWRRRAAGRPPPPAAARPGRPAR